MKWYLWLLVALAVLEAAARALRRFRNNRARARERERSLKALYPAALRAYRYVTREEEE